MDLMDALSVSCNNAACTSYTQTKRKRPTASKKKTSKKKNNTLNIC